MNSFALAVVGAIAIGVSLGLLGSGGSILTVPVLVYLVGQEEKLAIAGSLAIVGSIALVGSLPYMVRRLVDWRNVFLFGLPGMVGTYAGAWSSQFVSGLLQLTVFAGVMLASSYLMLRPIQVNLAEGSQENRVPRHFARIGLDGFVVGVLTGFVGVGGGFLIVPALVLLGGLNMHRAVATSLVIIALKSFTGFYKYLDVLAGEDIQLDLHVLFLVTGLGIAGSFVGQYMAHKVPQDKLKRVFGVFLIVMGIYILYRSLPDLLGW